MPGTSELARTMRRLLCASSSHSGLDNASHNQTFVQPDELRPLWTLDPRLRDTIVFNDAFQTPKSVFPQAGYFIEKVTRFP